MTMSLPRSGPRRRAPAPSRLWRAFIGAAAIGVLVGCAQSTPDEDTEAQPASPEQETAPDAQLEEEADSESDTEESESSVQSSAADQSDSEASSAPAAAAEPERVQIPEIDLDESLIDLGIQPDGRLEPPADWDDVGWFADGSRPGQAGPTVIAAHVDSSSGPAVFFRLMELEVGDEVTVTDAEGEEHLYRVRDTADFPKDDFPTRDVFGAGPTDELRLITCTGEFDDAAGRHLDNRVVFAERVE